MFHKLFCFGMLQLLIVSDAQAQDSKPQIAISKEITYITSPLRPDGRVDYVEALSQIQRKGVTPENNSVVMFRRALGHRDLKPEIADEYFRQLGMEVLPKEGNYLIDLDDFITTLAPSELPESGGKPYEMRQAIYIQNSEARSRPWTRDEFPIIASWIDANEIPLRFAVEGSARSRFFQPLLPKDRTLNAALVPRWQGLREFAEVLNSRAMLRLGEENMDAAWQDLSACHRIARLVGQGPTILSMLVAAAIEEMTCTSDNQIAMHGKVNAESYHTCLNELLAIGPFHESSVNPDSGDRYLCLDMICEISSQDAEKLAKHAPRIFSVRETDQKKLAAFLKRAIDLKLIDWNDVLRRANEWHERFSTAAKLPTRMECRVEVKRLDARLMKDAKKARKVIRTTMPDQNNATEVVGNMLFEELLIPRQVFETEDRCAMRTQLSSCSFALAAWREEHGSYPDQIEQLVPAILKSVPIDLFSGLPLIYRRTNTGYLLYSVGPNLKDDEGFMRADTSETDDIAIRTPDEDQRIQAIIKERRGQK